MKDWIDYLKNEENKNVISDSRGLISFIFHGKECHIYDFYIKPEYRKSGAALYLGEKMEEAARFAKCTTLSCNIFINEKNKDYFGRKVFLFTQFGFEPNGANNNAVTMIKKL